MSKEEKEKILGKLAELIGHYNRDITVPYALSLVEDMVQDMPITEPRETNLEHYFNEIQEILKKGYDIAVDYKRGKPCVCEIFDCKKCKINYCNKNGQRVCLRGLYEWLAQPYEKPKYKLTQVEYDLLNTYSDCNIECKLADCKQLRGLKEKGYFNDIDKFMKVHEILENCEVVE